MRTLVAILFLASMASAELLEAGNFRNLAHGIGGKVYLKDEKTLVIKDFTYDGAGPDAFFWVGTSKSPSSVGTILPYPFEGKFYDYEDNRAPILSRRFNKEEVILTLPDNLKTTDLKWMSVWCRQFAVNFGDIFFPENLTLEEKFEEIEEEIEESIPEELPPPLIEPVHNAHDPNRHDEDWKEDSDVYSEPESEAEAEGFSSADTIGPMLSTLLLVAIAQLL